MPSLNLVQKKERKQKEKAKKTMNIFPEVILKDALIKSGSLIIAFALHNWVSSESIDFLCS